MAQAEAAQAEAAQAVIVGPGAAGCSHRRRRAGRAVERLRAGGAVGARQRERYLPLLRHNKQDENSGSTLFLARRSFQDSAHRGRTKDKQHMKVRRCIPDLTAGERSGDISEQKSTIYLCVK